MFFGNLLQTPDLSALNQNRLAVCRVNRQRHPASDSALVKQALREVPLADQPYA